MNSSRVALSCIVFASLVGACTDNADTSAVGQATTSSGVSGTVLAKAHLGDSEIEITWGGQKAEVEGDTSLVMQELVIQPGGTTGWHQHGGPVLVSVVQGSITLYEGTAPCTGTTYTAGQGFVDMGNDVHQAKNLDPATPVIVRVQYILPTGAAIRIDEPAPAGADACP